MKAFLIRFRENTMKSTSLCHRCTSEDFLGVECAWPAPRCLGASRHGTPPAWRQRLLRAAFVAAVLATVWQFGHAGYIHAKAWLAQALIAQAWTRTLAGEERAKPWPWADTWPVARLRAPEQDVDLYVLAGADGRTIAQQVVDECARRNEAHTQDGEAGNVGVVVGATLTQAPDLSHLGGPVLMPGVGAQGASAGDVARIAAGVEHLAFPNISRAVLGTGPRIADLRSAVVTAASEFPGHED